MRERVCVREREGERKRNLLVCATLPLEDIVLPLSSEYGTYKTVKARFWPWRSGKSLENMSRSFLLARKRHTHDPYGVLEDGLFLMSEVHPVMLASNVAVSL